MMRTDAGLARTGGVAPVAGARRRPGNAAGDAFGAALREHLHGPDGGSLRFSRHAGERLKDRRIDLDPDAVRRLEQAADDAAGKGAREALMMMDGLGFIVDIPSRTVVTAVPGDEADNTVFTNIDAAVVVPDRAPPGTEQDSEQGRTA